MRQLTWLQRKGVEGYRVVGCLASLVHILSVGFVRERGCHEMNVPMTDHRMVVKRKRFAYTEGDSEYSGIFPT